MRKPKTAMLIILVGIAAAIALLLTTEQAQAHEVTHMGQKCSQIALNAARRVAPATRSEVALRRTACIKWARLHNAEFIRSCSGSVKAAIQCVFGPRAAAAICISFHESGWRTSATGPRDEYGVPRIGLFQLGTYERKKAGRYTTRSSAYVQALSARRWLAMTGNNWHHAWPQTAAKC